MVKRCVRINSLHPRRAVWWVTRDITLKGGWEMRARNAKPERDVHVNDAEMCIAPQEQV